MALIDLSQLALIFNFLGGLFIALAIGRPPSDIFQEDRRGRKIYIVALLRPIMFWFGVVLIILGPLLMFIISYFPM